jgi:hypothetical protein
LLLSFRSFIAFVSLFRGFRSTLLWLSFHSYAFVSLLFLLSFHFLGPAFRRGGPLFAWRPGRVKAPSKHLRRGGGGGWGRADGGGSGPQPVQSLPAPPVVSRALPDRKWGTFPECGLNVP